MPVLTFSINAAQAQCLQGFKEGDESDNLTAKRILLNAIGDSSSSNKSTAHSHEIEKLQQKIEVIESAIKADHAFNLIEEIGNLQERIEAIEKKFGQQQPIALDLGDQEKLVICLVEGDGFPQKFWNGHSWINDIHQANRYLSDSSLRRTFDRLKKRLGKTIDYRITYDSIGNLEKIIDDRKDGYKYVI